MGILQSNCWPCTGHPNNPSLGLAALAKRCWSSASPGAGSLPWGACSVPQHPLGEEPFCDTHANPPLTQLKPFPQVLSLVTQSRN